MTGRGPQFRQRVEARSSGPAEGAAPDGGHSRRRSPLGLGRMASTPSQDPSYSPAVNEMSPATTASLSRIRRLRAGFRGPRREAQITAASVAQPGLEPRVGSHVSRSGVAERRENVLCRWHLRGFPSHLNKAKNWLKHWDRHRDDEKIRLELDEEAIQYIVCALTNLATHDGTWPSEGPRFAAWLSENRPDLDLAR